MKQKNKMNGEKKEEEEEVKQKKNTKKKNRKKPPSTNRKIEKCNHYWLHKPPGKIKEALQIR